MMLMFWFKLKIFEGHNFFWQAKKTTPLYPGYMLEEGSNFFPSKKQVQEVAQALGAPESRRLNSTGDTDGFGRLGRLEYFCCLGKGQKFKLGIWWLVQVALGWFRLVWVGLKTSRSQQLLGTWNSSDAFNLVPSEAG